MPLIIVRDDITKMQVDAVVNAANNRLLGGGGVDGAIHRAAGSGLLEECKTLGGCLTGEAKITGGYNLPVKYIIHTVGPVWKDGLSGEEELLRSCYRKSLELARTHGCETVAFPLISCGVYGYPKDKALKSATDEIGKFLKDNEMTVYVVVFDRESFDFGKALFPEIHEYIDNNYSERHLEEFSRPVPLRGNVSDLYPDDTKNRKAFGSKTRKHLSCEFCTEKSSDTSPDTSKVSLEEKLKMLDESFSEMLLRKIDEAGMTDTECYKKANIDRKLFSKIRSDKNYRPSKPTVLAFAIALRMNIGDTRDFLARAGFAFSPASKFDVIVEYFITQGNYDIFEINNALFAFDQSVLGA